ncbi:MAG: flagellar FlbD family protein [Acidimicrobiia bacterium]
MVPVELVSGRRLLLNVHVIESIEELASGSVVVTDSQRYRVIDSADCLVEAIEAVRRKARAIALERLQPRRVELQVVAALGGDSGA